MPNDRKIKHMYQVLVHHRYDTEPEDVSDRVIVVREDEFLDRGGAVISDLLDKLEAGEPIDPGLVAKVRAWDTQIASAGKQMVAMYHRAFDDGNRAIDDMQVELEAIRRRVREVLAGPEKNMALLRHVVGLSDLIEHDCPFCECWSKTDAHD